MAIMKFGGVLLILAIGCSGEVPADGGMQRIELGPKKAGKANPAAIQDNSFRPDPAAIQDNSFHGIQDNTKPSGEKVPPINPAAAQEQKGIDPAVAPAASQKKSLDPADQKGIDVQPIKGDGKFLDARPPSDVKLQPR